MIRPRMRGDAGLWSPPPWRICASTDRVLDPSPFALTREAKLCSRLRRRFSTRPGRPLPSRTPRRCSLQPRFDQRTLSDRRRPSRSRARALPRTPHRTKGVRGCCAPDPSSISGSRAYRRPSGQPGGALGEISVQSCVLLRRQTRPQSRIDVVILIMSVTRKRLVEPAHGFSPAGVITI